MAKQKVIERQQIDKLEVRPGQQVRVHQKIKDITAKGEEKERIQVYEGLVIAKKHGKEPGATITVRKISDGVGVEKIFPLHSPVVDKIELVDTKQVRRAKLYYTRNHNKRLKSTSEKNQTTSKKNPVKEEAKPEVKADVKTEKEKPKKETSKEQAK